jgi:predicted nucleic acid-binding protein
MISGSDLREAISGRTVLIDSNIIIYLTDSIDPYQSMAKLLFRMVEAGEVNAVISILSVCEVMQGPLKQSRNALALEVKDYLIHFPHCRCEPITADVLELIGSDRSIDWKGLRVIDSLIIASGLVSGVDIFVSNDRHFQTAIPKSMMLSFD